MELHRQLSEADAREEAAKRMEAALYQATDRLDRTKARRELNDLMAQYYASKQSPNSKPPGPDRF